MRHPLGEGQGPPHQATLGLGFWRGSSRTAIDDDDGGIGGPLRLSGGGQAWGGRGLWREPDYPGPCSPPGLPVHPQGHSPAAVQPPAPDLPAQLHQEDPVPPGAAGPLLEALRLQQGGPAAAGLRAATQARPGRGTVSGKTWGGEEGGRAAPPSDPAGLSPLPTPRNSSSLC